MKEELSSQKLALPTLKDSNLRNQTTSKEILCTTELQLSKKDYAKYFPRISANLEEALISSILIQERHAYQRFYLLNHSQKTFTIRFKDLMKALDEMKLDDSFIILSMGVFLGNYETIYGKQQSFCVNDNGEYTYNKVRIMSLASSMSSFVIIKKDKLPYIKHVETKDASVVSIDEESKLYSNIDDINKDNTILKVMRTMSIVQSESPTKYVLLRIKYNSDSSEHDLNKICDIKNFI